MLGPDQGPTDLGAGPGDQLGAEPFVRIGPIPMQTKTQSTSVIIRLSHLGHGDIYDLAARHLDPEELVLRIFLELTNTDAMFGCGVENQSAWEDEAHMGTPAPSDCSDKSSGMSSSR